MTETPEVGDSDQGEDLYLTMPPVFVEARVEKRPRWTVFGAPRRFDLATIMAVTIAYALLFASLRALRAPPTTFVIIAGFITLVGVSQALLFGGKQPRISSLLTGAVLSLAGMLYLAVAVHSRFLEAALPSIAFGSVFGYLSGVVVGSVFMISEYVRQFFRAHADSNSEGDEEEAEP